ncbi:hypothetical protein CL622_04280 [archaeon]|nr:hypothetical protein [archaeon]
MGAFILYYQRRVRRFVEFLTRYEEDDEGNLRVQSVPSFNEVTLRARARWERCSINEKNRYIECVNAEN